MLKAKFRSTDIMENPQFQLLVVQTSLYWKKKKDK